ncbi:hypothetical protein FE374_08950 [Georgenia yuyongxinii]|uniref:Uncharacterized protein n=1 Tax=Georgenia yuyongxinii TaxID=2589797 RepID=A0A5B8C2F8_9MICO|nr:hypothetical protein [Georgenia yuyongxinii]QDC24724.1 hypothetical protein FE374_08950 [Georgenia yuyongxinii]
MSTVTRNPDPTPLRTDEMIERFVSDIIGHAVRRQVWSFFLDDDGMLTGPVIPVEDVPALPGAEDASGFGTLIGTAADVVEARAVILVWERPGPPMLSSADRHWLCTFHDGLTAHDVEVRAVLVSHAHGVRWARRDDYGF